MNVIGSMIVKLSAHIAEFDANLRKAAGRAEQTASQISNAFQSQSIAVGSFGMAEGITAVGTAARSADHSMGHLHGQTNKLQHAFNVLGRAGIGGGPFRIISSLAAAATEATGLNLALGVGATAGIGLAVAAVKLGNSIKESQLEAARLGITFEELKHSTNELAISAETQKALTDLADTWHTIWMYTKFITAEMLKQATQMSGWGTLVGPESMDQMRKRLGVTSQPAGPDVSATKLSVEQEKLKRRLKEWEQAKDIVDELRDKVKNFGNEWGSIADRIRARGAGEPAVAAAKELWDLLQTSEKNAKAIAEFQRTGGIDSTFLGRISDVAHAGTEAMDALNGSLQKFIDSGKELAETPIDKFARNLEKLYAAFEAGAISRDVFERTKLKLRQTTSEQLMRELAPKGGGAASALMSGSREAQNAIADSIAGTSARELDELRRIRDVLDKINAKPVGIAAGVIP